MGVGMIRCPECGERERIEILRFLDDAGRGKIRLTCPVVVHEQPLVTTIDDPDAPKSKPARTSSEGLVHQLELYPALEEIVLGLDQPSEYGIVEHKFAQRFPDEYRQLWDRYGHIATHGNKQYTLSAYLGSLLGNLAERGVIAHRPFRGTGRWSYNDGISAWANPRRDAGRIRTWGEYARQHGLDPDRDWPATEDFPDVRGSGGFWAYDNWVHKYTKVHRGSCSMCNSGRGVQSNAMDIAGEWMGPFGSFSAALSAANATGREVSTCATCQPA